MHKYTGSSKETVLICVRPLVHERRYCRHRPAATHPDKNFSWFNLERPRNKAGVLYANLPSWYVHQTPHFVYILFRIVYDCVNQTDLRWRPAFPWLDLQGVDAPLCSRLNLRKCSRKRSKQMGDILIKLLDQLTSSSFNLCQALPFISGPVWFAVSQAVEKQLPPQLCRWGGALIWREGR